MCAILRAESPAQPTPFSPRLDADRYLFIARRHDTEFDNHGGRVALFYGAGEPGRALCPGRDGLAHGGLDPAVDRLRGHAVQPARPHAVHAVDGRHCRRHGVQRCRFRSVVRPRSQGTCFGDRGGAAHGWLLHRLQQLSVPGGLGQRPAGAADRHGGGVAVPPAAGARGPLALAAGNFAAGANGRHRLARRAGRVLHRAVPQFFCPAHGQHGVFAGIEYHRDAVAGGIAAGPPRRGRPRARTPGHRRWPDRRPQSPRLAGAGRQRPGHERALSPADGCADARPRSLQADQRYPGPCRGRPGAAKIRQGDARRQPRRRSVLPLWRRGILRTAQPRRYGCGTSLRPAPARLAAAARAEETRFRVIVQRRHRHAPVR